MPIVESEVSKLAAIVHFSRIEDRARQDPRGEAGIFAYEAALAEPGVIKLQSAGLLTAANIFKLDPTHWLRAAAYVPLTIDADGLKDAFADHPLPETNEFDILRHFRAVLEIKSDADVGDASQSTEAYEPPAASQASTATTVRLSQHEESPDLVSGLEVS